MKTYWLHWLGVKYYSISSFINEAKRLGVSRRIPPIILRGMTWGDSVFMIGESPKFPGKGVLFGKFYVDRVKYATKSKKVKAELAELLMKSKVQVFCEPVYSDPRGCGMETEGGYYLKTTTKVKEIGEVLSKSKSSRVNITGAFFVFSRPVLLKIDPFRGYKAIEEEELDRLVSSGKEINYKQLLGSIDVKVAVEDYLRAYVKGNKKSIKKLRKIFKADGVWNEVKKVARKEIEEIKRKKRELDYRESVRVSKPAELVRGEVKRYSR